MLPADLPAEDLGGGILAPGFVDAQVDGGDGLLFNATPDADTAAGIAAAHRPSWLFPRPDGAPEEITPPSRMRFDDLGTIRDAALSGQGLAWLPCWLIRDEVAAGRLATVLDHLPSHIFDTHALWPQAPYLPLRVRLAIDALAAALPGMTSMPSTNPSEMSASTLG